jgi:hypothetical protein
MSDGGISGAPAAGYGGDAHGTGSQPGYADNGGLHAQPDQQGMTEEQARDVLNGLVDERLTQQFDTTGLDRLHERMEQMSTQQRSMLEQLAAAGYDISDLTSDETPDGDVLDELDTVLTDAVDRRLDAAEAEDEAEILVAARDVDFDDLRDRLPMLQDDATAQSIVSRACELCAQWGQPELMDTPDFVTVVEQVAMASYADPSVANPTPPQSPAPGNGTGYQGGNNVQLEAAAGAAQHERTASRPPDDQQRFMNYVAASQSGRI